MSISLSSADMEQVGRAMHVLLSPLDYPNVDAWRSAVITELKALLLADTAGFHLPVEQVGRAMHVLLSPLDYPNVDAWRSAVVTELKALLLADTAGFHLPVEQGPLFYTDDYPQALLEAFADVAPPLLPDGTDLVERGAELGVSTLERAYGPHVDRYYRSEFFNEYASQIRKYDLMFSISRLKGSRPGEVASLQFFHDRPAGRRFCEREIALLRLLFPAFAAGAETWVRWSRHRHQLLDTLGGLDHAAMIIEPDGAVHHTPGLSAVLDSEPQAADLVASMRSAGESVRALSAGRGVVSPVPQTGLEQEIVTCSVRYRARAWLYGAEGHGTASLVVVGLDRLTPRLRSMMELRELFGLTPAEARIAVLLAHGRSNARIAEEICISPYTARRHTERILKKLGIRSRSEAGGRIFL